MSSPRWDELAVLRERVADVRGRHAQAQVDARRAARDLDRARGAVGDYVAAEHAEGREPDEGRLGELREQAAGIVARMEVIHTPQGVDVRDVEREAAVRGLGAALADAEQEVVRFEREHRGALVEERVYEAVEVGGDYAEALLALFDADAAWTRVASELAGLGQRTGMFTLGDLPAHPMGPDARRALAQAAIVVQRDPEALVPLPPHVLAREEA